MGRVQILFELQEVDQELDRARNRVREIDELLSESYELRSARQSDHDTRQHLTQLVTQHKDLELESESLDNKIKSVEKRTYSGTVTNPKELNDLQMEITSLRRRQSDMDGKLLELMIEVEQAEADKSGAHNNLERIQTRWDRSQVRLAAERQELTDQIEKQAVGRETRRAAVPQEDLESYDHLRSIKQGDAIAALNGSTCGACGYTPSVNTINQIRRHDALVTCSTCGRIQMAA